jgi:hypothetical protein
MSAQVGSRDKKYIPASKVWRDRYGVSPMTGWRWEHDGTLGFPKPYYMGRFKYFAEDELEAWERSLPRKQRTDG